MEGTHIKKIVKKSLQILLPLVLGAAIMIWMYRGFNFGHVWEVLDGGMDYSWMLLSLVFGVFSHIFRGWRWKLTLAPLGEYPKTSDCVYAVFMPLIWLSLVWVKFPVAAFWQSMTALLFPSLWGQW